MNAKPILKVCNQLIFGVTKYFDEIKISMSIKILSSIYD